MERVARMRLLAAMWPSQLVLEKATACQLLASTWAVELVTQEGGACELLESFVVQEGLAHLFTKLPPPVVKRMARRGIPLVLSGMSAGLYFISVSSRFVVCSVYYLDACF